MRLEFGGWIGVVVAISLAWASPTYGGPMAMASPEVSVVVGRAASLDGRQLLKRDGNVLMLESAPVLGSHALTFTVAMPVPDDAPKNAVARVAFAMHGPKPLEIAAKVWLPKSRVWQRFTEHEYLPTKKGGVLMMPIPLPNKALAGKSCEVRLEIMSEAPNAAAFKVAFDAVSLQVAAVSTPAPDVHRAATRATDNEALRVKVHHFSGRSSRSHKAKQWKVKQQFKAGSNRVRKAGQ